MFKMDSQTFQKIQNEFHAGYYNKCIQRCSMIDKDTNKLTHDLQQIILYRCLLESKKLNDKYSKELITSDSPSIQAIGYFSYYKNNPSSNEPDKQNAINILNHLVIQSQDSYLPSFLLASIYANNQDFDKALSILQNQSDSLEVLALKTSIFLMIFRYDLAQKNLDSMSILNHNSTLTKFVSAWMFLVKGEYGEALTIFEDIQSDFDDSDDENINQFSIIVLNGLGASLLLLHNWSEALPFLEKALKLNPQDSITLENLVCCCRNLNQHSQADLYFNELNKIKDSEGMIQKANAIDQAFIDFQDSCGI